MDLFRKNGEGQEGRPGHTPLAARMRPRTIEEIVGQEHILAPGRLLRRAIEADRLNSLILYGPPGCGKTSLAEVIAATTRRAFERTSGVTANVTVLRSLIDLARHRRSTEGTETILFVDEIHRFSKSQQDVLLPYVEDGTVTLIGATTHNPMFFINSPLTSRSMIFELAALKEDAIRELIVRAANDEHGLGPLHVRVDDDAAAHLAMVCEGDARRALNAMEIAALTTRPSDDGFIRITLAVIEDSIQKKAVVYDHDEDGHYDTISAFIKSVRGSDPHAAVYWLAKMLYAGEDPRFIARRLVILASEDIGNADPRGLSVAVAAMHAVEFVGMPEGRIILSQATTYLATAPKSNAAYLAVDKAMEDVEGGRVLEVPEHLRNIKIPRAGLQEGSPGYVYPHNHNGHFTPQEYVPTANRYYEPTSEGYEETIRRRMEQWDAVRREAESERGKEEKTQVKRRKE